MNTLDLPFVIVVNSSNTDDLAIVLLEVHEIHDCTNIEVAGEGTVTPFYCASHFSYLHYCV
ncbi:hypothetical protein D3C76_870870 [compost metagenome]